MSACLVSSRLEPEEAFVSLYCTPTYTEDSEVLRSQSCDWGRKCLPLNVGVQRWILFFSIKGNFKHISQVNSFKNRLCSSCWTIFLQHYWCISSTWSEHRIDRSIFLCMWTPTLLYYPLLICKWMRLCVDRMQAPQEPCINVDARCLIDSCLHLRLSFSVESYLWMRIKRMDVMSGWRLRSWSSHVTRSRTSRSALYDRLADA